MTRNWLGLLSIGVFYVMVLATGIWASRKSKREERKCTENRSEVAMVGRRNLNIWVSIFTMTGKTNKQTLDLMASVAVVFDALASL